MNEWLELARLQSISGDSAAAKASLEHARQSPDSQAAYHTSTDYFSLGTSISIFIAYIEQAAGNKEAAFRQLDELDATLNRFEQDGGACAGLYWLRALSRAVRGDPDAAMQHLRIAHDKGWREARAARSEPYLQSLRNRQDFQQLLSATERELRAEATAIVAAQ